MELKFQIAFSSAPVIVRSDGQLSGIERLSDISPTAMSFIAALPVFAMHAFLNVSNEVSNILEILTNENNYE